MFIIAKITPDRHLASKIRTENSLQTAGSQDQVHIPNHHHHHYIMEGKGLLALQGAKG